LTETTPETKEWKQTSALLENEPAYEDIHEAGRRAASETDRIIGIRSLRMFRGAKLRSDDRLNDALAAVATYEALLTARLEEPARSPET